MGSRGLPSRKRASHGGSSHTHWCSRSGFPKQVRLHRFPSRALRGFGVSGSACVCRKSRRRTPRECHEVLSTRTLTGTRSARTDRACGSSSAASRTSSKENSGSPESRPAVRPRTGSTSRWHRTRRHQRALPMADPYARVRPSAHGAHTSPTKRPWSLRLLQCGHLILDASPTYSSSYSIGRAGGHPSRWGSHRSV